MTTASRLRLLAQSVLARNPDLAYSRRIVFIKPVTHFVRGVAFAQSLHKGVFHPNWFACPTFEGDTFLSLNFGDQFLGRWEVDLPDIESRLIEAVEGIALPKLRPVETFGDYVAFASTPHHWGVRLQSYRHRVFVHNVALGHLDEARAFCPELRRWANRTRKERSPRSDVIRYAAELAPLVEADDRESMARLLWRWETELIKAKKFEKHWVKEPFPLEVKYGLSVWKERL